MCVGLLVGNNRVEYRDFLKIRWRGFVGDEGMRTGVLVTESWKNSLSCDTEAVNQGSSSLDFLCQKSHSKSDFS